MQNLFKKINVYAESLCQVVRNRTNVSILQVSSPIDILNELKRESVEIL